MKDALLLVIGALISVWTGIVTTRWFFFHQQIQDARNIVLGIPDRLHELTKCSEHDAHMKSACLFQYVGSNLLSHGFRGSASFMPQIGEDVFRMLINARGHVMEIEKSGNTAALEGLMQGIQEFQFALIAELNAMRPDLIVLFFGDWMGTQRNKAQRVYRDFCEYLETGDIRKH